MKKIQVWCAVFAFLFTFSFLTNTPHAAEEAVDVSAVEEERFEALATIGALYTEDYWEGIGDVVIPLHFTGEGLLFLNPRASFTDRSEQEYNIGVGYRHLIQDRSAVVGANVFYDHRETRSDISFGQVGLGAEYLSHRFDARANVYLPLDTRKKVDSVEVTETAVSRRMVSSTQTNWDDIYATGNSLNQPFQQVTSQRMRTTTTTTSRMFETYEVALRGWDAEIGTLLPLDALDDYIRLKVFAGYYKYYGRYGLDDVDGFRGRLEAQLRPAFVVDATYYSNDDLTGGNFTIGAYVSVPFDLAALANGRNPFAGAGDRWNAGRQSEDMTYRLIDMVKRDPQIRTGVLVEEAEEMAQRSSSTRERDVSQSVTEGEVELVSNMTFVDKDNEGNPGQDGTVENPYETIELGIDNANSPVWVFDSAQPYMEHVDIPGGIQLLGNGTTIEGFGDKVWGGGLHPVVIGQDDRPTITILGDNVTVAGLDVQRPGDEVTFTAIYGSNVSNIRIHDNLITSGSHRYGIYLANDGSMVGGNENLHARILRNVIQNTADDALYIYGRGGSGAFDVEISGTYSMSGGSGVYIDTDNYDTARAHLYNIAANDNEDYGISARIRASQLAWLRVDDTVTDRNDDGLDGRARADSAGGEAWVIMNNIQANENDSWGLYHADAYASHTNSGNSYVYLDNIVANNNDYGMDIYSVADGLNADAIIFARNLTANDNEYKGISYIEAYSDQGGALIDLDNVMANNNDDEGIYYIGAEAYGDGHNAIIRLNNVMANNNESEGIEDIYARADGENGNAIITLNNVVANNNYYSGIEEVYARADGENGHAEIYILNAQFNNNEDYGIDEIDARAYGENGHALVMLYNVDASYNEDEGLDSARADAYGDGGNAYIIMSNVTVIGNGDYGMDYVEATARGLNGNATVRMVNVIANDNGDDGIWRLQAETQGDGGHALVEIENLTANNNADSGISQLYAYTHGADANANIFINNMTLNNNDEYGIDRVRARANDSGSATVVMNNVTINGNEDGGIDDFEVLAKGVGNDATVTIDNLTMNDNEGDGLEDVQVISEDGSSFFTLVNSTLINNDGQAFTVNTEAQGAVGDAINTVTNVITTGSTGYSVTATSANGTSDNIVIDVTP